MAIGKTAIIVILYDSVINWYKTYQTECYQTRITSSSFISLKIEKREMSLDDGKNDNQSWGTKGDPPHPHPQTRIKMFQYTTHVADTYKLLHKPHHLNFHQKNSQYFLCIQLNPLTSVIAWTIFETSPYFLL